MISLQLLVRTLNWKQYMTTSTTFRFWNTPCNLIQMSWFYKLTELSRRNSDDFQACRKVVPCRMTFRRHYNPSKRRWIFTSRHGVTSGKTWTFVLILFKFGINKGTFRILIKYARCMTSNLSPVDAQYASYTFRHSRGVIIRQSLC